MIYNINYTTIEGNNEISKYYTSLDIKNKLLNILEKTDKLLKKHNIKYTLSYGTLLGAVRHNDIIPWDDDIDLDVEDGDLKKLMSNEFNEDLKKNDMVLFNYHHNNLPDKKPIFFKIYDKNGSDTGYPWKFPFVDIFIIEIKDGKYIKNYKPGILRTNFSPPYDYYNLNQFNNLIKYKFNRLTLDGISNPEEYLDRYYKKWRTYAYISCWNHEKEKTSNNCGIELDLININNIKIMGS